MTHRIVLGPARCKGCGRWADYIMRGSLHLGWRHVDGRYCQKPRRVA